MIGDATTSFLSSAVPKETKLSEDNNSVHHIDSDAVSDRVSESQPETLQSATDTLHQTSLTDKAKKKKTKSKKRSEKIESISGSTGGGISTAEFDSAALQLPLVVTEESCGVGKRSKKFRNDGQIVRSEDVDGYCGSLPVDDLIEFIDCGRKLWRSRSRPEAGSLTETEKLHSVKKESNRDAAVENDSGFGDTEIPDRTDGSHSDDALSPSVSSISESVEIVVELLSDSLNAAGDQSTTETLEEKFISSVCEIPASTSVCKIPASTIHELTDDSELSFAAAFLSDEEIAKPEPEFTVVRQKKRRTKNQKVVSTKETLSIDKTACHLMGPMSSQNSSVICSSASSERSNSPQSVAAVSESIVDRQQPDTRSTTSRIGTSSVRRFNSEPKWRPRHPPRHHPSSDSFSELQHVHTQKHASGNPSARRWLTASRGKFIPFPASLQQREVDKMKDRKYNLSAGIPHGSQLPDVVPSAERPSEADKPGLPSSAKVIMQDAHCQTVDDTGSPAADGDSGIDTCETQVPFDLLTLQLFMYHAFEDVMNMSKSCSHGICFYSTSEAMCSSEAVH